MPPPRRTTLLNGLPAPTAPPSLPNTHLSAPPLSTNPPNPPPASTSSTAANAAGGGSTPPLTSMQSMDAQFEPLDVIGTGSFGIIRKVRRKGDGLLLARKELNYGRMDERDLRQLGEEVNILQNLGSNEYIVRYHERYVDKQNFMLYILMEYCAQGDLAGLISRCRRDTVHLAEETVWSYLSQITSALADCHSPVPASPSTPDENKARERGVILHRDIKPENVFLDHDGIVKLGDFGLSKAMEMAAFTNTYVGTPYYMSPELINGQQYDVKSDIWALGCLIYELCAWHPPFHQAQTQPELAKLIREGKIPNLPRGYSSQLTALIKSMLRQDPKLRPDTKAILSMDQVKLQLKILEVHRYARELNKRQEALHDRESSLIEREQRLRQREARLASERETFRQVQASHAAAVQTHQRQVTLFEREQRRGTGGGFEDGAMALVEEVENVRLDGGEWEGEQGPGVTEDGVLVGGQQGTKGTTTTTQSRIARRPLETTRASSTSSSIVASFHSKRLSALPHSASMAFPPPPGSPMQLDTPVKTFLPLRSDGESAPAQAQAVRQVKSSKSMVNISSTTSSSNQTASSRSLKKSDESTATTNTTRSSRSSNDEAERKRFGRRSDSSCNLAVPAVTPGSPTKLARGEAIPPVPSRRPLITERADTAPQPSSASSSASSTEDQLHHAAGFRVGITRTATAPPGSFLGVAAPDYDSVEDSNPHLPSPFLRKKPSAQALMANLLRPSNPSGGGQTSPKKGAPPVPTRPSSGVARRLSAVAGGGSGARATLAGKLLSARQSEVNEAQVGVGGGMQGQRRATLGSNKRDSSIFAR